MQNNQENSKRFRRFIREKGYYIVLIFCVAAVGVSGYFFVRTALSSRAQDLAGEEASVSVPVRVEEDKTQSGTGDQTPSGGGSAEEEELPSAATDGGAVETIGGTDAASLTGLTVWPVSGDAVQTYSMDRLSYCQTMRDWRTHDGLDIAAAQGAPVRAAMGGTVREVYDDDFLGTVVVLSHANGYETLYANLTEMPSVSVGDTVSAGQTIGAVGRTALGESAEVSHLHFAAYRNGVSIDPASILP